MTWKSGVFLGTSLTGLSKSKGYCSDDCHESEEDEGPKEHVSQKEKYLGSKPQDRAGKLLAL